VLEYLPTNENTDGQFPKLLTRNSRSKIQKNSPTGLAKASALMVGGMFMVVAMSC
jgi:hypothetical protein